MSSQVNPPIPSKHNKNEPDEVKNLRKLYSTQLSTLKELFTEWSEEDLLFAIQEAGGDLEVCIDRISEGHTSQWDEVKGKKPKKPHNDRGITVQPPVDKHSLAARNAGANERLKMLQYKNKGPRYHKSIEKPRMVASTSVKPVILDSQGNIKTYAQSASYAKKFSQDTNSVQTTFKDESRGVLDALSWGSSKSKHEFQGLKTLDPTRLSSPHSDISTSKLTTQPKISWAQIVKPVVVPLPSVSKEDTSSVPKHDKASTLSESASHEYTKIQEPTRSDSMKEYHQVDQQERYEPEVVSLQVIEPKNPVEPVQQKIEESQDSVTITAGTDGTDNADSKEYIVKSDTSTSKSPTVSISTKTRVVNVRKFKQDSPVVMPSGNSNLERMGVQFGSLTLSTRPDRKIQTIQKPEINSQYNRIFAEIPTSEKPLQATVPEVLQNKVAPSTNNNSHPYAAEIINTDVPTEINNELAKLGSPESASLTSENINETKNPIGSSQTNQSLNHKVDTANNTLQNQTLHTLPQSSSLPIMNTFGKQNGQQSPYLSQPQIGNPDLLNSYGSYMGGQPQNQFSNFGMGPMGDYGATLYGNDAQRALMGYYAEPYGQLPSNYQRDSRLQMQDSATSSSAQAVQNTTLTSQASPQSQSQQLQHSYPELAGIPYYPYYYVPNQFHSPAYQQSGYGQPFMSKNIYPYYGSQQSNKSSPSVTGSPYTSSSYPSNTLNQPSSYVQDASGVGRFDDISLSTNNNNGIGSGVSEYPKGYKSDIPLQGFLGSSTGQQQNSSETSKNSAGQTTHDSPYKSYAESSNIYGQNVQGAQYSGYQQQYAQQTQQYQQYHMQQQPSGGYHHQQGRNQGYWS